MRSVQEQGMDCGVRRPGRPVPAPGVYRMRYGWRKFWMGGESMTTLYEAARAALNAWEYDSNECRWHMDNLRAALDAAPKQADHAEPVAWHVCSVNSDGSLSLEFAAPWEELAHEHISDAILDHDIDGAGSWVVRPVYATPQPIATAPANSASHRICCEGDCAYYGSTRPSSCACCRAKNS